ncbi:hypothetical protein [Bradyrhizobium sp. IC3195]|uniref:hypothetical protein n=1 Tax=Bradyrhizobium sp. IC3195 TaxID=2793804 RepID=UPI001CD3B9AE|nr:hypothetical protein [Bradyrhizobium sp. IC3195]
MGAVAELNPVTAYGCMDYRAFTNDSLTMMYESVRGALASDDAQKAAGDAPRFRVRETKEWKEHAGNLEAEMLNRGMFFEIIDWSEDQGRLPL